jgi:ABC-type xylose transport system permease subunit
MFMTEPQQPGRRATPLQVVAAVLCAFVGIRKRAAHERDAVSITPAQVIVAGVLLAAIFVLGLVTLARFIAG